jgi:glucosamine-6-phosphate deaminase
MQLNVFKTPKAMGAAAAKAVAAQLREAISARGKANLIVATGASQFEMLKQLIKEPRVDWTKATGFHLDEYINMKDNHPASFRRYLRERFVKHVSLREFHFVNGDSADGKPECKRLGAILKKHPIDVACIGIGENGHLAFNDPPADFETTESFLVVNLDEGCRKQQFGEGWFKTLEDVPKQAISMSIRQILAADTLIVTVPDARKADAVKGCVDGELTNRCPSSILRIHADCRLFLDEQAASKLSVRWAREAKR